MQHHNSYSREAKGKEKEYTLLEINSYKIARASFFASLSSVIIAIIYGYIGICYMANSPDKGQIKELYNLNWELSCLTHIDLLTKRFNGYNDLDYHIIELRPYTVKIEFKKKTGVEIIEKNPTFRERLNTINSIYEIMNKMKNVYELIPNENMRNLYGDCMRRILNYKLVCIYVIGLGSDSLIDTSVVRRKEFDTLIYNVIDLTNELPPYINEEKIIIAKELKTIDSLLMANKKKLVHN